MATPERRGPPASQAFSKLFPNLSKLFAWNLQAFPNIFSCVLSLFKGLRGAQEPISYFQAFLRAAGGVAWDMTRLPPESWWTS